MQNFFEKLKSLLPRSEDPQATRYFKIIIFTIIGTLLLMVAIGLLIFFLNLDTLETTQVPDLSANEYNQTDIITAISKIQEKGLNTRIQVKHSSEYSRGVVVDQKPKAGSLVKVGRYVTLTVSIGGVLDNVKDYRGKKLDWVRSELRQIFASSEQDLLKIDEEGLEYVFDESEGDTILEQEPAPGTDLVEGKVTYIKFKLSKGPGGIAKTMDSYVGLYWKDALLKLAKMNVAFVLEEEAEKSNVKAGRVSFQSPGRGEDITPESRIEVRFKPPEEVEKGQVYGVYRFPLREYDINVKIQITVSDSKGSRPYLLMEHRGGNIAIPYIFEENSEISLYVFGELVDTQFVGTN